MVLCGQLRCPRCPYSATGRCTDSVHERTISSVTEYPDWDPHWIVIADSDGDAIVVDDSTASGTVSGIGSKNFKIADDLASFFQVMAEAISVEAVTFDYEVEDDDFNLDSQFLDAVRASAQRELGPDGEAEFMKFFFS